MVFLNPLLAIFGLASISVPIIIHLLNRRKFERVTWAAMKFLQISVEQNQRRIQIEDLLLLALRCLLLLILGLALARLAFKNTAAAGVFGQAKVTAVFVLDNSYSMSGTDGVRSRFDQAKDAADQVLNALPAGSSASVVLASDIANAVIPEPTYDLNLVRRTLKEARLTDRTSDLYPSMRVAVDTLKDRPTIRKEIYLFTDGQLIAWKQLAEARNLLDQSHAEIHTHLVFVGSKLDQDLGVSNLRLASGLAAVNLPLRYEVQVTNFGNEDVRDTRVSLKVDNDAPADESTIADISAHASKTVSLFAKLHSDGFHTVTAVIPSDHLPADDQRTIAVRGLTQVRVLLVAGDTGSAPRDSSTFFLKQILLPVPAPEQDQYWIKVTTITPAELEQQKFDGFDCVMLADVADFTSTTLENFAGYLARGGGLMIFPGANTQANFYNAQLLDNYHFLPASLGDPQGDAEKDTAFFSLQDKNFQHPIASIWSDAAAGTPSSAHFYRSFTLTPTQDLDKAQAAGRHAGGDKSSSYLARAGTPRVVLRYGKGTGNSAMDQKPAVMERAWGLGRVILFSSTADTRWTDLPVHPGIFVPLIYRCLGSIIQRQDEGLNIPVGQKFIYHPDPSLLDKYVLISKPPYRESEDGKNPKAAREEAPDSAKVEMSKDEDAPVLTYDATDIAGGYECKLPDGSPPIRFAAQADPAESNLDEINPEQLRILGSVADVVKWTPGNSSLTSKIEKERTGTELWLPLAALALALAVAETLLADWFSRSK